MKTLKATGQLLYKVETDREPHIPKGKVRVHVVQYQTFEIDQKEFDEMTFQIHDANAPEPREITKLVML